MKPTRVLVADSSPVVREGLCSLLGRQGPAWEVCATAGTGPEAVARAAELRPDIVIIDDQMPLLDGQDAAAAIRREVRRVEILIFSGSTAPPVLAQLFHSKVAGCLLKTDAPEELLLALETIRRHNRFRSRGFTELAESYAEINPGAARLTRREIDVVRLIVDGLTSQQVAERLGVSAKTIESHRSGLFAKLGIHTAVELTRYAIRNHLAKL